MLVRRIRIRSSEDQLFIYMKNKCEHGIDPKDVVIFIHGATWPMDSVYDLKLDGTSWMDMMAKSYNTYAFDSRGYGRSDKPVRSPDSGPVMVAHQTYNDLFDVIAFIKKEVEDPKINLVAWSAGCVSAFSYAIRHPDQINTLTCYGLRWLPTEADGKISETMSTEPYFDYVFEHQKKRIHRDYPEGEAEKFMPKEYYGAWEQSFKSSPQTQVPTGAQHDARVFWFKGRKMYDPSKVKCPAMLVA